jgi:hypothetical protein
VQHVRELVVARVPGQVDLVEPAAGREIRDDVAAITRAEDERVVASATSQDVGTATAVEPVVDRIADQPIASAAADGVLDANR